jgi:hypothetical protein
MRRTAALLAALLAVASASEAREWYEAYQEALRALARGQYQPAVFALEEAIRQRPAPGANVRTYGTNVERTYHPYLKLAEAQLGLGSAEGARAALQRSESLGVEPAEERSRLRARADALAERLRPPPSVVTTIPPPTTTLPPPPSTTPPPTALAAPPAAEPRPSPPPVERRPTQPAPTSTASAAPERTKTAALEIFSEPAGASVYVDDEPLGATSRSTGRLIKRDLAPGRHQVRIALQGYEDLVHEVELAPGATTTLRGPLVRSARRVEDAPARPGFGAVLAAVTALAAFAIWLYARRASAGAAEAVTPWRATPPGPASQSPGPRTPRPESATPTPEGELPARFGEYMLLERIGRGGMATVFKAERNGELRALKRPRGSAGDDPQFLERFLREAEIGRTLHHPNVVRIYERGEADGVPYFTMELIEGETLAARLKREGVLPPAEAARMLLQIAEALDYAHHKGVIHRDLKPSNTMVDREDRLRVMDFGIARAQRFEGMTVTGSFLGSPDYAAPESIEGRSVDARSDLYSVGVILFELLTGRRPFEGDTPFAVLQKHCTEPPPPPSRLVPGLPPELDAITLRLLAKPPDARFASAEELLLALRGWLDAQG